MKLTIRKDLATQTSLALENGYRFASEAFEDGPELLFLTSDLSHNPKAVQFISTFGCEPYFHYSEQLMFQEKRQTLLREIAKTLLIQIQSLPLRFLRYFGPIRPFLRSSASRNSAPYITKDIVMHTAQAPISTLAVEYGSLTPAVRIITTT